MSERRTEGRQLCADMIEVEWTSSHGQLRIATALLEDISPFGICIQMEVDLPVNAKVVVRLNGKPMGATVRYSCWREIGYFAGLTFPPGFRWSADDFRPQHLTNPLEITVADSNRVV